MKVTGPLSYHVERDSGHVVRRHVDAVRNREPSIPPQRGSDDENDPYLLDAQQPATPPAVDTGPPPAPPPPPAPRHSTRHQLLRMEQLTKGGKCGNLQTP